MYEVKTSSEVGGLLAHDVRCVVRVAFLLSVSGYVALDGAVKTHTV
jgi:hypothetical protein